MKKIILVLGLVLGSINANAAGGGGGWVMGLNPFYWTTTTDTGTSSTTTYTFINPMVGFAMSSGLYIGGMYQMETITSGTTTINSTGYGPSIGYMNNGFVLVLHYILSSTRDIGSNSKYLGSGYELNIGKDWMMGGSFFGGIVLSYAAYNYPKIDVSGTQVDTTYKFTSMRPGFRLGFMF